MRKAIDVRVVEAILDPQRVLKIRMAHFAGMLVRQCRHPHAVVVDQFQAELADECAGNEQDVAVLQIGVGEVGRRAAVPSAWPTSASGRADIAACPRFRGRTR